MSVNIGEQIALSAKTNLDSKWGPYESLAAVYEALGLNKSSQTLWKSYLGLTVGVYNADKTAIDEYWFKAGKSKNDLVLKQSAAITIDSELSNTSTNAVQNKVIKAAIDTKVTAETGKSLVSDTDIAKITKVEASVTNGKIKINDVDTIVYDESKSSLGTQVATNTTNIATLTSGQEELTGSVGTLTNSVISLNTTVGEMSNTVAGHTTAINTLDTKVTSLESRGRFLSVWDLSDTYDGGKPQDYPAVPTGATQYTYEYKTGDYYIITNANSTAEHKYMPANQSIMYNSGQWTVGRANLTEIVYNNDYFVYTTSGWLIVHNSTTAVTFSNIQGEIADNTKLQNAFNEKQATLPKASAVGKILKSTNTSGGVAWGDPTDTGVTKITAGTGLTGGEITSTGTIAIDTTVVAQKADLATVATTGDYSDLTNRPTIPTTVAELTDAEDYAKTTAIPTKVSQLSNDSGYLTNASLNGYATQEWVTSKRYVTASALTGYATTTELTTGLEAKANYADLKDVATTGDYSDLTNRPTIPTKLSELSDGTDVATKTWVGEQGYIGTSGLAEYAKKTDLANYAKSSDVNTALSGKQDTISDLTAIRNGATAGATALQPSALDSYSTTTQMNTAINNHHDSTKQDTLTGGAAGTAGSATKVPVITTNSFGQVTSISEVAVQSGGAGTVTSITAGTGLTGGTITSSGTIAVDTSTVALKDDIPVGEVNITLTTTSISDGTTELDISGKQDTLPAASAAGKVLKAKSTTAGDVEWGDASSYTAGTGIKIDTDNKINFNPKYTDSNITLQAARTYSTDYAASLLATNDNEERASVIVKSDSTILLKATTESVNKVVNLTSTGAHVGTISGGNLVYEAPTQDTQIAPKKYVDDRIQANPAGETTANLSSLQIGTTKYKVSGGGSTYAAGTGIEIDSTQTTPTISIDEDVVAKKTDIPAIPAGEVNLTITNRSISDGINTFALPDWSSLGNDNIYKLVLEKDADGNVTIKWMNN